MADPIPNKLNGLVHRKLVRELALGEENQAQLAERYNVSPSAISHFAKRNRDEIQAVRDKADDEYAGLLITQKANRLAALEQLYAQAITPQPKVAASGRVAYVEDPVTGEQVMVQEVALDSAARMLKQAAEEMGQLPTRVQLTGELTEHITYKIEGPDDV